MEVLCSILLEITAAFQENVDKLHGHRTVISAVAYWSPQMEWQHCNTHLRPPPGDVPEPPFGPWEPGVTNVNEL